MMFNIYNLQPRPKETELCVIGQLLFTCVIVSLELFNENLNSREGGLLFQYYLFRRFVRVTLGLLVEFPYSFFQVF